MSENRSSGTQNPNKTPVIFRASRNYCKNENFTEIIKNIENTENIEKLEIVD